MIVLQIHASAVYTISNHQTREEHLLAQAFPACLPLSVPQWGKLADPPGRVSTKNKNSCLLEPCFDYVVLHGNAWMPCSLTQGKISNYRCLSLQRAKWGVDSQEKTWRFPSLTLKENRSGNDGHCIPNSSQNVLSVGKFLGQSSAVPPGNAGAICQRCGLASTLWLLAY